MTSLTVSKIHADCRQEMATMLRDLRRMGVGNDRLRRPMYDEPVYSSNGQDVDSIFIHYKSVTVKQLKEFLAQLPDHAYVEVEQATDWDGHTLDYVFVSAMLPTLYSDVEFYQHIKCIHTTVVKKDMVEITVDGKTVSVPRQTANQLLQLAV